MTSDIIFIGIIIVVALLLLSALRKLSGAIKAVILTAVLVLGTFLFVIFVPTSAFSMWITENISSGIELDSENKYTDGDVIYSFDRSENDAQQDTNEVLSGISNTVNPFVTDRIDALISQYISLGEKYTLSFKDAYLVIIPESSFVTVQVIKGTAT